MRLSVLLEAVAPGGRLSHPGAEHPALPSGSLVLPSRNTEGLPNDQDSRATLF